MDLYSASVYALRGELRRLKKTFELVPISQMKRKDVLQHIEIYNKMVKMLDTEPKIESGSGKLPPRPIYTESMDIEGFMMTIPQFPEPRRNASKPKD